MGIIDNFDVLPIDTSLNDGRYQIDRVSRERGGSRVYYATSVSDGSGVTILEWSDSYREVQPLGERFAGDSRGFTDHIGQYAQLHHDSLFRIHDCFSEMNRNFVVIEKIEGRNFAELFSTDRPPPLSDIIGWLRELFDVVQYLHTRPTPIAHGSIVPANVWIDRSLKVKLSIPLLAQGDEEEYSVLGVKDSSTISYRSLENIWPNLDSASRMVIAGSPFAEKSLHMLRSGAGIRSDVYSLAATTYFALTGVVPTDVMTRVISRIEDKPDPLLDICELNLNVAESISGAAMKGLSIMPADRYATVSEMHRDFLMATHRLYDELTGLPTRAQFNQHLRTAIAESMSSSRSFAVFVVEIGDYELHSSRDGSYTSKLLANITKKLKLSVRPSDVVARLEMGKFGLLLTAAGTPDDLMRIAERIQSKLAEPEGSEFPGVATTIGIVMSGDTACEPDNFLADADGAVASAKQLGTSRCTIYDPNR